MARTVGTVLAACLVASTWAPPRAALAEDWPMYRHDAARTAASGQELPRDLHLQWVRALPPRRGIFVYDRRMQVDEGYMPIVAGGTLYVGLEATNSLLALDAATGRVRWRYYAEGPIRFAPVFLAGKVCFGADDGCLYCLDARDGRPLWKFRGAPADRKIINHERLSSNWPVSGGPVSLLGNIFFACGVWPIDGTLAFAVDAATGRPTWTQPSAVSLGYMAVAGNWVIQPSGKYPTLFDASTGARRAGPYDVKNLPTCVTAGWGTTHLFNGNKAYALDRGQPTYKTYANAEHEVAIWTPVIDGERIYGVNDGIIRFFRRPGDDELPKMKRKDLIALGGPWYINSRPDYAWSRDVGEKLPLPPGTDLPKDWFPSRMDIKAGSRLFASGPGAVVAIDVSADAAKAAVSWVGKVDGRVMDVVAGADRLFVTTDSGKVWCFGAAKAKPATYDLPVPPASGGDATSEAAKAILDATDIRAGYCLVLGLKDARLAEELHRQSQLRVIAVDPDAAKVDKLRARLDEAGLLGRRLVLRTGEPMSFDLPPYMASLIVSEDPEAAGLPAGRAFVEKVFAALRPYGGTACLGLSAGEGDKLAAWAKEANLYGAAVQRKGPWTCLSRAGALAGADDWTHERHDNGNRLISRDSAVVPPLGLLWYGGPAAEWKRVYPAFLPPALEVVAGRYIMQGHGLISCVDVYTGRLLWERQIPKVIYYGAYIGEYQKDPNGLPVFPEEDAGFYRGGHAATWPGEIGPERLAGNACNVVSMPDEIYVTLAEKMLVLDGDSGKTTRTLDVPFQDAEARKPLCWGGIRVVDDVIVATFFDPADIRAAFGAWFQGNEKNKQRLNMRWLTGLDRGTGKVLWKRKADSGWLNWGMAVGNGRVYALDLAIPEVIDVYARNGWRTKWPQPMVCCLDLKTGGELWKQPVDVLVTNPAYSEARDVLVLPSREAMEWKDGRWVAPAKPVAAAKGRDDADPGVMIARQGKDGKVLWRVGDAVYYEPVMIHHDTIVTRKGLTFGLLDGKPCRHTSVLTGEADDWRVSAGACNFLIGSEYITTHRTCYYDLRYDVTCGMAGMRSGCTPSIVPANGVLSLFNYSHNYPSDELRSAMALVSRPQNANWISFGGRGGTSGAQQVLAAGKPVRRLGLNLAAPADQVAGDGTAWLRTVPEEPQAAPKGKRSASDVSLAVILPASVDAFSLHPAAIDVPGDGLAWVAASGFVGLQQIAVRLVPLKAPAVSYTVRLHFAEPENLKPGRRVFDVALQGSEALKDFDIVQAAGAPRRAVVREFKGISVKDNLTVTLRAQTGLPLLCGIEVVAEGPR